VIGLVSVAVAAVLLVIAIAPSTIFDLPHARRESLVFAAFALVLADVLAITLLRAYATYYFHRHGGG
jgi:hypothetical protein